MDKAPLSWVSQIQSTLIDTAAIPLSGSLPDFPWEEGSRSIANLLGDPECTISTGKVSFLKENEVSSGFGSSFFSVALELTPLPGQLFWIMGKQEVAELTALTLTSSHKGFSSPKLQEGFYYYLATQAVLAIDTLKCFGDLSLKIAKPALPPQEEALCIDVAISCFSRTFWGRIVCPASFHHVLKAHFSLPAPLNLTSPKAKQIPLSLHLEVGQTTLSLSEWKNVKVGDCILLDRCTFDPHTHKGHVTLMLGHTPLFRLRVKETNVKIIDYAIYRQEENPMDPQTPDKENPEDFSSEHIEEEGSEETGHLWSSEQTNPETLITSEHIPLTLSVEVARLTLSLEKLLQLSPGNTLELPVKPEQGVDVVINGKTVAKAELIKMGDMLGIKILQIGS